jgi:hypothetical protein
MKILGKCHAKRSIEKSIETSKIERFFANAVSRALKIADGLVASRCPGISPGG